MTDHFSTERAGFMERLGALAGKTTYREPVAGRATRSDFTPSEHYLAMALSMGKDPKNPRDIGHHVAYSIAVNSNAYREIIVRELAVALKMILRRHVRPSPEIVASAVESAYDAVVAGRAPRVPEGMPERTWRLVNALAEGTLWRAAWDSLGRAEKAHRGAA